MKTLFWTFLVVFALCISTSCEKREINQRAGTYIGEAEISCSKKVYHRQSTDEIVIFNGTYTDTFTVEVIDIEERKYHVSRSSMQNGPCRGSLYDIGLSGYEYVLDDEFFWGYAYKYDKEWQSRLDIADPEKLIGFMFERDVFGYDEYDDQGNITTTYYTFDYRIEANKQK